MIKKQRITRQPVDTKLKELIKNNERTGVKQDFFELLKRAARPTKI